MKLGERGWGQILSAVLHKHGLTRIDLTSKDLDATAPFDLDVVEETEDGGGAVLLVVIPPHCSDCDEPKPLSELDADSRCAHCAEL